MLDPKQNTAKSGKERSNHTYRQISTGNELGKHILNLLRNKTRELGMKTVANYHYKKNHPMPTLNMSYRKLESAGATEFNSEV